MTELEDLQRAYAAEATLADRRAGEVTRIEGLLRQEQTLTNDMHQELERYREKNQRCRQLLADLTVLLVEVERVDRKAILGEVAAIREALAS